MNPHQYYMKAYNRSQEHYGFCMMNIERIEDIIEKHEVHFYNPGNGIPGPALCLNVDGVDYYREIDGVIWYSCVSIELEPCAEKFIRSMAGPGARITTLRVKRQGTWPVGAALLTVTSENAISKPMLSLIDYQEAAEIVNRWINEAMKGQKQ